MFACASVCVCVNIPSCCMLLCNSPAGNYPEESIQHSEHGESLKSRISLVVFRSQKGLRTKKFGKHWFRFFIYLVAFVL